MPRICSSRKAGLFDGNFAYYLAGFGVYVIVGLTGDLHDLSAVACRALRSRCSWRWVRSSSRCSSFESTKRFFEAWLAQLANYAFVTILTVLVAALMLHVVTVAAQQAVSEGGAIQIANAVRVCMAAGLTFLVMRQVMPMAAGLASGLALSTFGVVSAALAWGFGGAVARRAAASAGDFAHSGRRTGSGSPESPGGRRRPPGPDPAGIRLRGARTPIRRRA